MAAAFPDARVRAVRDACQLALHRDAAQTVVIAVHLVRRDHPNAVETNDPDQAAADALAVRGAVHWDATLANHQEVVHGCPWEAGRDFLWAKAEREPLVLPE